MNHSVVEFSKHIFVKSGWNGWGYSLCCSDDAPNILGEFIQVFRENFCRFIENPLCNVFSSLRTDIIFRRCKLRFTKRMRVFENIL